MNAIILCGGMSTRLGEITKNIPKVLLEIKGKTVLDLQLEKLSKLRINEVVLAAGHLAEVLQEQIGNERNGVKINYAIESQRLGTGGAIKFAWDMIKNDEPTFVLNGDILTGIDLLDMAEKLRPEGDGIILGQMVDDACSYGTLIYNEKNHLGEFKEKEGINKAGCINGGFYLLTKNFKKYFPEKDVFSIEYEVFPKVKDLDVYVSSLPWIDIGVPERLEWARNNWK